MPSVLALSVYILPLFGIVVCYQLSRRRIQKRTIDIKAQALRSGLTQPASLHPVIDPLKCLGCATCINACPEQQILGLINNKVELISPANCIGHGACKTACPVDAISLVFGTESRGVDIPDLTDNFESTSRGIYIAGELGGMGLIRNAVEQGKQAMQAIDEHLASMDGKKPGILDVVIVGAGPAGISAALYATQKNLNYVVIEQDSLGGTVSHFPRGKVVMTSPATLPLVGKVKFSETSKENLLEFWSKIESDHQLNIRYHERFTGISRCDDTLTVITTKQEYTCRAVLLAIGRRGTPRKLDIPGEQLAKVTYRLVDPEQFRMRKVLVVGGGDSALEAAHSIADQEGSEVLLCYRGDAFSRAKEKNRHKITLYEQQGKIRVLLNSSPVEIMPDRVVINTDAGVKNFPNDHVIVCVGGVLPDALLDSIGIGVTTKFGTL